MASYSDKISCLQNSAATSPEYAEIVPFFIEMFRYLEQRGAESGITFTIPAHGAKGEAHCVAKFPLFLISILRRSPITDDELSPTSFLSCRG